MSLSLSNLSRGRRFKSEMSFVQIGRRVAASSWSSFPSPSFFSFPLQRVVSPDLAFWVRRVILNWFPTTRVLFRDSECRGHRSTIDHGYRGPGTFL